MSLGWSFLKHCCHLTSRKVHDSQMIFSMSIDRNVAGSALAVCCSHYKSWSLTEIHIYIYLLKKYLESCSSHWQLLPFYCLPSSSYDNRYKNWSAQIAWDFFLYISSSGLFSLITSMNCSKSVHTRISNFQHIICRHRETSNFSHLNR